MGPNVNEVATMKQSFDDFKHVDENGKEYWNAHELSRAMGYSQYQKFKSAIDRAKDQMAATGKNPDDHLIQSSEMVQIGSGVSREVDGYKLDKLASYTVAMNADPSKTEVAFAQEYFLQNTAKAEVLEKRMSDRRYIDNRNALSLENNRFAATLLDHDVPADKIGVVLDAGDQGFFDMHTKEVKELAGIPSNKPVADIMGEDLTAFKKVAQIMSRQNIEKKRASGVKETSEITYDNNRFMRNLAIDTFDKTPEEMLPFEDVKKVEKKYDKQTMKLLKELNETEF
jgi:DNA-damage-inducible protein D